MKDNLRAILGWFIIQTAILTISMFCWNIVMPSLGINKINFLQIMLMYVFYKIFTFDWVKYYNDDFNLKK